jgi:hypothetical protein
MKQRNESKLTLSEIRKIVKRDMEIEKELKESYIEDFIEDGFSPGEAKKTVKALLKQSWKIYHKGHIPEMSGDRLIEEEKTDEKVRSALDKKRQEGVTDEDIKWWWNMHDLERNMILLDESFNRNMMYRQLIGSGIDKEEAMRRIKKCFVCYRHTEKLPYFDNTEAIVPIELKKRIVEYIDRRADNDDEQFMKDIEEMGTLTELVRREIANGKL